MPAAAQVYVIVISEAAPSIMAASTTWPGPERPGLEECRRLTPKARSIPPPPKSPTRLRGGAGRSPGRPIGAQRPRDRDVVDVVAGHVGPGAVLAPAGHPPVDEAGVPGQALVRAEAHALCHPRVGSPR